MKKGDGQTERYMYKLTSRLYERIRLRAKSLKICCRRLEYAGTVWNMLEYDVVDKKMLEYAVKGQNRQEYDTIG